MREDVQVIVVDDCSPDADTYIERFPELSRPYLEFYSTDRGGSAGRARNVGLKHAKGKWLIFADADDFFNYCFEEILNCYKDSTADLIVFNANSVDSDFYVSSHRTKHLNHMIDLYQSDPVEGCVSLRYAFGEPWSKIIRRSIVDDSISFDETPIHNDTFFSYMVGHKASSFAVDRRAGYCVTTREGSVSRQVNDTCLLNRVEIFAKKNRFLSMNGISYFDSLFWQTFDYARDNGRKDLLYKSYLIAEKFGYDRSFIMQHFIAVDKARKREENYQSRRAIINKIKRILSRF